MTVILGPAPCMNCGRLLYFDGQDWQERPKGRRWVHVCPRGTTDNPWTRDRMASILRHRMERAL